MVLQDPQLLMTHNYFYGDISEGFVSKDQNKKAVHQLSDGIEGEINNLQQLSNAGTVSYTHLTLPTKRIV